MLIWIVILFLVVTVTTRLHAAYVAPKPKDEITFWWQIVHHILGFVAYPCFIMECLVGDFKRSGVISIAGWFVLMGLWPISLPALPSVIVFFMGSLFWFVVGYGVLAVFQEIEKPYPFADPF